MKRKPLRIRITRDVPTTPHPVTGETYDATPWPYKGQTLSEWHAQGGANRRYKVRVDGVDVGVLGVECESAL